MGYTLCVPNETTYLRLEDSKMKKWICLLAVLAMIFSFAACSAKTDDAGSDAPEESAAAEKEGDAAAVTDADGQNPVMNFIGNYAMDRATILVESEGMEDAKITVRWSGSAWEHAEWVMTGKFDADKLTVDYQNAVKTEYKYSETGELESEEVIYDDGTGTFTFAAEDDGSTTLTWDDATEHIADDMVFEYVGFVPAN